MKICVLGLDGATPDIVFADERLVNIRRLMELGVYGKVEGVLPPGAVPGWVCLAASQDPGSLGIYGLRQRLDRSYSSPALAAPPAIQGSALWDQVASEGKETIIVAVPPNSPPRALQGISISCFLTLVAGGALASPAGLQNDIRQLLGDYAADVTISPAQNKEQLRHQIFEMSRKQWDLVRWLLREQEWDYFHFVDIGLDRVQRAFGEDFDPEHPRRQAASSLQNAIPDYYLWLDEQIGSVLEFLDAETVLLLASANGMARADGGFAINQWLIEQGLLVLNQACGPGMTSLDDVNWARTRAWCDGGPWASIYFNVEGREPHGIVSAAEYDSLCDQIADKLESLRDADGRTLGARVFRPSEIYRQTRNVAPDLVVQLSEGHWSSVASIGHPSPYIHDLTEACTPCGPGIFVLTSPNCPLSGEFEGAHLLDLAPTLLDLAGYQIPSSMQGRSLVAGMEKKRNGPAPESEQIIMDRLSGLGYV